MSSAYADSISYNGIKSDSNQTAAAGRFSQPWTENILEKKMSVLKMYGFSPASIPRAAQDTMTVYISVCTVLASSA